MSSTALTAAVCALGRSDSNGGGVLAKTQAPVGGPKPAPLPSVDHRKRLEALRDRLEAAVAEAGMRDLAPLAARYQSVLAELAAFPAIEESDGIDDLSAARRRRRAGASTS